MKRIVHVGAVVIAGVLMVMIAGCCTTTITYSYDPFFSFPPAKTYRWMNARYVGDTLLEANVRFIADKELASRGLSVTDDGANLLVWIGYESSLASYSYGYCSDYPRRLTLYIARADNKELVWRGMATGGITADAPSADLQKAVEGMLANFPPKQR